MYGSTRFSPCTFKILFKFKFSRTSLCRKIRFEIGRSFESCVHLFRNGRLNWDIGNVQFGSKDPNLENGLKAVLHISELSRFMIVQFITLLGLWPFSFANTKFLTVQFCDHLLLWPPCFAYFCRRSVYGRLVLPRSFSVFYWTNYFTNDRPLWSRQC